MSKWINVENRVPDDDRQVIVSAGRMVCLSEYRDKSWWGTYTIKLGGVTRWMEIPGEPRDIFYWWNLICKWWKKQEETVKSTSDCLTGWTSRNAQLGRKPVFYVTGSGEITSGMPENIPVPRGYEKVVCNSVQEAEHWSERQRQWDRAKHGKIQEDRQRIEEPIHQEIRSEMHNRMSNARNNVNREFMRRAIETSDGKHSPWKYDRESYLHSEAFEEKR